jgi:hypothetical protein
MYEVFSHRRCVTLVLVVPSGMSMPGTDANLAPDKYSASDISESKTDSNTDEASARLCGNLARE